MGVERWDDGWLEHGISIKSTLRHTKHRQMCDTTWRSRANRQEAWASPYSPRQSPPLTKHSSPDRCTHRHRRPPLSTHSPLPSVDPPRPLPSLVRPSPVSRPYAPASPAKTLSPSALTLGQSQQSLGFPPAECQQPSSPLLHNQVWRTNIQRRLSRDSVSDHLNHLFSSTGGGIVSARTTGVLSMPSLPPGLKSSSTAQKKGGLAGH
jgi:hypothetical protein